MPHLVNYPTVMLTWYSLILGLAISQLIFANLHASEEDYVIVEFSRHQANIEGTKATLEDDFLKIEMRLGHYLICFREGQLLFPNNALERKGEVRVQAGDTLVWTTTQRQHPNFLNDLFPEEGPRMHLAQLDLSKAYHLQVVQEKPTIAAMVKNQLVAKKPIVSASSKFVVLMMALVAISLLLSFAIMAMSPTPTPPTPDCAKSSMRQYYWVSLENDHGPPYLVDLHLEVPKNCSDTIFYWDRYVDAIFECLAQYYPSINPNNLKLGPRFNDAPITPIFIQSKWTPRRNCSLPINN